MKNFKFVLFLWQFLKEIFYDSSVMETRNYQWNFTMFWFHFQSVAVSIAYDRSETPQEDYIWSGECQIDLISKVRLESYFDEFIGVFLSRHQGKHFYMTLS